MYVRVNKRAAHAWQHCPKYTRVCVRGACVRVRVRVPVGLVHVLRRDVAAAVHLGHGLGEAHHGLELAHRDAPRAARAARAAVTLPQHAVVLHQQLARLLHKWNILSKLVLLQANIFFDDSILMSIYMSQGHYERTWIGEEWYILHLFLLVRKQSLERKQNLSGAREPRLRIKICKSHKAMFLMGFTLHVAYYYITMRHHKYG